MGAQALSGAQRLGLGVGQKEGALEQSEYLGYQIKARDLAGIRCATGLEIRPNLSESALDPG